MSTTFANCPCCDEHMRLRTREFSDQAMSALIAWGEIDAKKIGLPLCDDCYEEMREVLIDRVDDLGAAQPTKTPKVATKAEKKPKQKAG